MNRKYYPQPFHTNPAILHRVSSPLLVLLFTALALLFVSAGYWFYTQQARVLRAQKTNELQSIAALKAQQIVRWRMEHLVDARVTSTSPFFNHALDAWLADPKNDTLTSELLERIQLITVQEEYHNVILTDPQGKLLLSADPQVTWLEAETQKLAAQAAASGEIRMADFMRSAVSGKVTLAIAAPFSDGQKPPAAVIVFQIDPEKYLYPLIQSWPVPSQSAETLLIQKEGTDVIFLNPLRFRSDPPLTIRIPLTETDVAAVQAILGRTGEFEGSDYRGVKVLSNILPIPDTPWFILAKVDQTEILAGVRSLGLTVLLVVLLAVLMTAVLAVYTFNHRHRVLLQSLLTEEQQRRQAQEQTRTTLYSIGDGVICTDGAGLVTILNPIAETLTGWSEAEARGKPLAQIFHIISEETRLRVENPVERVLREGRIVGLANHTLLVHRDGTERPIADSSAPIRGADGKITGVVLVFRDQTAERAAQRERALLNFTISTSLNEIYLFDAQTLHFRFVNDGAIKNLGYSMDQLRVMTPVDIKPEFTAEAFQKKLEPLLNHDISTLVFETHHQRADGSRYPVEVHLQLFEYEGEQVFLAVSIDITERRQVVEALRKSEDVFQKIFEILPIGLWLADKDGTLLQGNPAGVKIWGMEPKVSQSEYSIFKGRRLPSRAEIAPDDWSLAHTVNEGVTVVDELLEIDAFDGKTKIILNSSAPIMDSSGAVIGAFVVNQDVTERYQAEEALRKSEERFRVAQEMSPDGFTILHPLKNEKGEIVDFVWVYENQVIARINGTDPNEVVGKRVLDLFPRHQGTSVFEAYIHTAATGQPQIIEEIYVGEILSKPTWLRLVIFSMGEEIAIHAQDVTDRRWTDNALRESEEKYRTLFAEMMNAFALHEMVFDDRGDPIDYIFLEMNPAWERTVGLKAENVIGKRVTEVLPTIEDDWIQLYGRVVKTGISQEFESYNAATHKYYQVYAYRASEGKFAVFFNDVTERKQAEIRIIEQLDELKRWQKATLGREGRILELKREVNELLTQSGQPPRYHSPDLREDQDDSLLS